jgi:RHS repeat-associated protein
MIASSFDTMGDLTTLTPSGESASDMGYNLLNMMTQFVMPALSSVTSGAYSWSYDADHRVTQFTRPSGTLESYSYDPVSGLPTQQTTTPVTPGTSQFQFVNDPVTGNLTSYTQNSPGGTPFLVSFSYQGPLLTHYQYSNRFNGSVGYSYDSLFRLSSRTVTLGTYTGPAPGSYIDTFGYDPDGLLTYTSEMTLTHDPVNGLLTATRYQPSTGGNPISETLAYDSFGALISDQVTPATGAAYYTNFLTRDSLGRITGKTETVLGTTHVWAYQYDVSGRLIQVALDGGVSSSYTYDGNGNRLTKTTSSGTVTSTYDARDELVSAGTKSYSYDADGNLLQITDSATDLTNQYQFNSYDTLLTAIIGSNGKTVTYSAQHGGGLTAVHYIDTATSVATSTRYYISDLTRPLGETEPSGGFGYTYQYATGSNTPDTIVDVVAHKSYRVIHDERGSVRLVIDAATGQSVQELDYDEFGVLTNSTNPGFQTFQFAGGISDTSTGLVKFGQRFYDPSTGRFVSRDPLLFGGGQTNLYNYTLDDPINFVDSTGLDVTVNYYAGGAGHIGVAVNNGPSYGYYSSYGSGGVYSALAGLNGDGHEVTDASQQNTSPALSVTIHTTPGQDATVQSSIDNLIANGGAYNLYSNNCSIQAHNILGSAGIDSPSDVLPANFISGVSGMYSK